MKSPSTAGCHSANPSALRIDQAHAAGRTRHVVSLFAALCFVWTAAAAAPRPNIVVILADDLGFSDLGCYGSEIATPNLDRLAAGGLRFRQFYNAGRCCPTRASLLTGLYPHQAGVGHMLNRGWPSAAYTEGLNEKSATVAELLRTAGYRTYHVGKWHVGGFSSQADRRNRPLQRGFDRAYTLPSGSSYFKMRPVYLDHEEVPAAPGVYATDAFTDRAVQFIDEHFRAHRDKPLYLHLCYTAPHFPLHAKPEDIAKYRGKYRLGWDALREQRFARQKQLGIFPESTRLSPRDPLVKAWTALPEPERDEWDLRMAVYAAMIDCMDQGVGRVLAALEAANVLQNTLVVFLSDNGASPEFFDTWPNPTRGHKPGAETGSPDSYRCLEEGWSNAANTPFREHKMWVHEGGIATPLIASWPEQIRARGAWTAEVGHVIDLMPTFLELAGATYPGNWDGRAITPLPGRSLAAALRGDALGERTLAWEHEGNRAYRRGQWKLVATFKGDWELYNLSEDPTELDDLAASRPREVAEFAAAWQRWADRVGVVPWEQLPGANYRPSATYRKKSESPFRDAPRK